MFGLVRFLGGSEPLAWTLQWMMSGTVVVALVMAWRSRLPYALKAAALATATLLVTPYLFLYDEMVLAIPVALLVRIGLADGFSEYELPALGCVALLLMSFPWVGAPVRPRRSVDRCHADRAARWRATNDDDEQYCFAIAR